MSSLHRHEGYLFIDGGIRQDGTAVCGSRELPTFTCCHCGTVVVMNVARTRPRSYCARCDHWACDNPVCSTECHPIKQSVNLAQRYPDSGQPFLLRGPRGEILSDPKFEEREKLY